MVTEKVVRSEKSIRKMEGFVEWKVRKAVKYIPSMNSENVGDRWFSHLSSPSSNASFDNDSVEQTSPKRSRRRHTRSKNRRKAMGKSGSDSYNQMIQQDQSKMTNPETSSDEAGCTSRSRPVPGVMIIRQAHGHF